MIKYPSGVIAPKQTRRPRLPMANAANRGMSLEHDLNKSNDYYNEHDLALITKRPTPINVVKVDYSHGARITDAYFEKQSTTDYNGIYKGKYLDFEAKSTISKSSFPLSNIYAHQHDHLKRVISNGGIAFFIIRFALLGETYVLPAADVLSFKQENARQSMPLTFIKTHGRLVLEGLSPRLNYLKAVDELFFAR